MIIDGGTQTQDGGTLTQVGGTKLAGDKVGDKVGYKVAEVGDIRWEQLIIMSENSIRKEGNLVILGEEYQYDPSDLIGEGSYAKVLKGVEIKTGRIVAVKICSKQKMDVEEAISLEKEIHIMRHIQHPNIVDFYSVYMDEKNIYLVLEYLEGGELYEHIMEKEVYTEMEAREALLPIIDAVRYLHQSGIVHRDLKPENIVYTCKEGVSVIKIIDFGVSQIITNSTVMSTAVGTPMYMAPEIFTGEKYRCAVDVWSIGVILYVLLCGYPPFEAETPNGLQEEIKAGEIEFDPEYWADISEQAVDLVKKMLQKEPEHRITIDQIYDHPWMFKTVFERNLTSTKVRLRNMVKRIRNALKVIKMMKKV